MDAMANEEHRQAALCLSGQPSELGRSYGLEPLRLYLHRITCGRLGQPKGWPDPPQLNTPWQDTISPTRSGWRQRAANLYGETVFGVDYKVCRRCKLAWVEEPHTEPEYQRCGLAKAGLAALRTDFPQMAWHTLGGHFSDAQVFWSSVSAGVRGGYEQRDLCPHIVRY